jgi:hypothetical protein
MSWRDHIPEDLVELYEIHDFKHAACILRHEFTREFDDLCRALTAFRYTVQDVINPGGNESSIPKRFSDILRPLGWVENQLNARIFADEIEITQDTHKIDYLKGRVAFDLEWNSKDQTFDRDLFAFKTFFDFNRISLGVLVTRSNELDPWFESLGDYEAKYGVKREYKSKYGASTTHMGKLLPRLRAGRNGGCPILVFGITPRLLRNEE